ncbi:MAG TPA: Wzz/FepE/Etk N-terminal domain-containing protein, partial [Longimicrobiales bacterium]|nr:Wzz/FepE/Etk N-terminal domain-containing protein [Longimicrobiales bacterium]
MSDTSLSVPGQNGGGLAEMPADGPQGPYLSDWDLDLGPETAQGLTFQRALLALRRFWWLILIAALLGVAGGFVAYRMVEPVYTAGAEILVSGEREGNATPIQADPLMQEQALIDLLKSPEVVEPVVRRERLFLSYPRGTEDLFMGFDLSPEGARFGRYEFAASGSGEWTLLNAAGVEVDQGRAGDAVGASVGFEWNPPPAQLQGGLAPVEFAVRPPRETATSIRSELLTNMNEAGNFIRVSYASKNPELAARVVNGLLDEFQAVAASLKEDELEADLANLVIQLEGAKDSLYMVTEMLESFRIRTMSEPRQQSIVTPGGTETLRVPQQDEYLSLRGQQQDVDRQLQVLRSIQAEIPRGGLSIPRLESVPRAAQSAEISGMLLRLAELRQQRSDLLLRYTPQHPSVLDLDEDIRRIEQEQIPVTLSSLIDQLARESSDLQGRIAQADSDMRRVPRLMSEEQNLQEEQRRFQTLVNDLSNRRTLAEFAFRSSLADFQVLSDATVPFTPSSDKRLSFAAVVFIGFLGLGLGGALVLDRMDSRFRYPEDVTSGIGVDVLGMIPRVSGSGTQAEVEEAFRDLRMRLMYAHGSAGPLMVVFSSPGPGEGKTLITANLALAFAKIGRRTLVIDADTRRGDLHRL